MDGLVYFSHRVVVLAATGQKDIICRQDKSLYGDLISKRLEVCTRYHREILYVWYSCTVFRHGFHLLTHVCVDLDFSAQNNWFSFQLK